MSEASGSPDAATAVPIAEPARTPWMEEVRVRLARASWTPALPGEARQLLKRAAVLVPLFVKGASLHVLLTKRSDAVETHKGQVSFPGGGIEPDDAHAWDAALREAEEEVGIPRGSVRLLGALPERPTTSGFLIAPFVGAIPHPIQLTPHGGEVERLLEVPVAWLLDPRARSEREVELAGRTYRSPVFHVEDEAIWGATARILADLLAALR